MNLNLTGIPLYLRANIARARTTLSFWDIFVVFIVGFILIKSRHLLEEEVSMHEYAPKRGIRPAADIFIHLLPFTQMTEYRRERSRIADRFAIEDGPEIAISALSKPFP